MRIDPNTFGEPLFSQREAVDVVEPTTEQIDSWVRFDQVDVVRVGRRRFFTGHDVMRMEFAYKLTSLFRIDPSIAFYVAAEAYSEYYRKFFRQDVADIEEGRPWDAPQGAEGDVHLNFTRAAHPDVLRLVAEGDDPANSVMVILPARLIARKVLSRIAELPEAER